VDLPAVQLQLRGLGGLPQLEKAERQPSGSSSPGIGARLGLGGGHPSGVFGLQARRQAVHLVVGQGLEPHAHGDSGRACRPADVELPGSSNCSQEGPACTTAHAQADRLCGFIEIEQEAVGLLVEFGRQAPNEQGG